MILPLSAGLLTNTERYFESLNNYRTGEIEPLVSIFVDATFRSLDNASRFANTYGYRTSIGRLHSG